MADVAVLPADPAAAFKRAQQGRSYWRRVWERLRDDKVTLAVIGVLAILLTMVVFAPWFAVHDPYTGSVLRRLKPVGTPGHWLGTDEVGRDLWARMVFGGRLSLLAGVMPVFLALLIGGFLGSGLQNTILALTISFIPPIIRISESVTTQVRHLDFVEAARASGAGPLTIMRYHILKNILGPILVYATSLISICIILSACLSFLGLGVTPPSAEWGLMLNNLRQALWVSPLVAALPGVMIFITSMCFNLMSDGLRQAMDVRL